MCVCVYLSVLLEQIHINSPFYNLLYQTNDDDVDDDNHKDDATLSIVITGFTDGCFMLVSSLGGDLC